MNDNQKLGATGRFPQGKLNEQDQGEIKLAIGVTKGRLVMDFGKSVSWVALTKEEVEGLIELLTKRLPEL